MKRTLISLTVEQGKWVKAEAEKRGCSVAQVIRDLVLAAMEVGK